MMALYNLEHKLFNLVRRATLSEVDPEQARLKVTFMNNQSAWLPWLVTRAAGVRSWSMPQVGEDVLIISPEGDTESAIVLPALYKAEYPAPSQDPSEHLTQYQDGALISYNDETHKLSASLPAGSLTELISENVTITGNVTINGTLHSTDSITTDSSISAAGNVSDSVGSIQQNRDIFNSHNHTGDSGGMTGPTNQKQ